MRPILFLAILVVGASIPFAVEAGTAGMTTVCTGANSLIKEGSSFLIAIDSPAGGRFLIFTPTDTSLREHAGIWEKSATGMEKGEGKHLRYEAHECRQLRPDGTVLYHYVKVPADTNVLDSLTADDEPTE